MGLKKIIAPLLLAALASSAALAAPAMKYACDPESKAVYAISHGQKKSLRGVELEAVGDPFSPQMFYARLDPEQAQSKIPTPGIALFTGDGKFAGLIPVEGGSVSAAAVVPSPLGTKLIVSQPRDVAADYRIFTFPGLDSLGTVTDGLSDWLSPAWADEDRFAYSRYDDSVQKPIKSVHEAKGYTQVELYDLRGKKSTVIRKFSPTEEFYLTGCHDGFVTMTRFYVTDQAQWDSGHEGSETPGEIYSEQTYAWLPDWKPYGGWKNPESLFAVNTDNRRVYRLKGSNREELPSLELHKDSFTLQDGGEEEFCWFHVDPSMDPSLKGEVPAVYVFNNLGRLTACFPVEEGSVCQDLSVSPDGVLWLLSMGEGSILDYELYQNKGGFRHRQSLKRAVGDFVWIDSWRVAYSALNIEAEHSGGDPAYAVDALLYDAAVDLFTPLAKGDAKTSYWVTGRSEEGVEAEKETVQSSADWKTPGKPRRVKVTLELPAAG